MESENSANNNNKNEKEQKRQNSHQIQSIACTAKFQCLHIECGNLAYVHFLYEILIANVYVIVICLFVLICRLHIFVNMM